MEMPTYLQIDDGYELVEGNNPPPVIHSTTGSITSYRVPEQYQPPLPQSHIEIELSKHGVTVSGDIGGNHDIAGLVSQAIDSWALAEQRRHQREKKANEPTIAQQDWVMGLAAMVACLFLGYFGIQMFSNRIPTNPVPTGNYYQLR